MYILLCIDVSFFIPWKKILGKFPAARIFMTGRPLTCTEIEKGLAGRVASVSNDIAGFLLLFRLKED